MVCCVCATCCAANGEHVDIAELDYNLPPERIATRPSEPRDSAKLLVCSRSDPNHIEYTTVAALDQYLSAGDVIIRNITRVLPARIAGVRADSGGKVEGLFVEELAPGSWAVMLKSNGTLRASQVINLIDARSLTRSTASVRTAFQIRLIEWVESVWHCDILSTTDAKPIKTSAKIVLEALGATPLPPYILRSRAQQGDVADDALDRAWYQTVFAKPAESASIAAPTAGLHFTDALLNRIQRKAVHIEDVTLDVGAGTFKPIDAATVEAHRMHCETYHVAGTTLAALDAAHRAGHMRLAIGTTTVRCLESVSSPTTTDALQHGVGGATQLFIRPGFTFRRTDALLTNFHLPRSTLLTLVGALFPDGVARVRELYALAIREQYRFYSYGDAMLVLP